MTRGDIGIVLLVCLLVAAAVVTAAGSGSSQGIVIRGPHGLTHVDTSMDQTYQIEGHDGTVVFESRDGELVCVDSSCPDHICVKQGVVGPGRPVVCVPNGVVASFEGQTDGGLDAVSR